MSCGKNHAYDAYQTAADALKSAVIEALNNDEETSTLTELWGHYLGARSIADKAAKSSTSFFGDTIFSTGTAYTSTSDYVTFGDDPYPTVAAADTVAYNWGEDGISITGNPYASDTVDFSGIGSVPTTVSGGTSVDTITFG
tara:strand:- start:218 stop:640 length:423 start_codon:yes stop_codon:yes gene_type:complete